MLIIRNGEQLLLTIIIPVILLAFFGNVDALPTAGDDRLAFLVPGVLAVAIMSTSMVSLGIATGFERSYLVLKRLGATPLTRGELVTAKILSVCVVEVIQMIVLIPIGLLIGWSWGGTRSLLAVPVVLLGTSAFAGIGLLLSGRLKAEINLAAQNGLYLLLLLLGGMIIPVDSLPGAVGTIARWLPSTAMSDLLRATLNNSSAGLMAPSVTLACWAVITPLIAARRFRWS
jgi:ABC-2 type transport system permease protein